MPTVRDQLASVWNYISGAGVSVDNIAIWVFRDSVWLKYDTHEPIDEIGFFRYLEAPWLYAAQDCILTYKGMTTQLTAGWNNIAWLVEEEVWLPAPPTAWMDMLMPIIMIGMMGYTMWPMIKGLFKKEPEQ